MIKELSVPKQKAENFLYRVTDQSWDNVIKDEKGKLRPPEQLIGTIDWTLRLEAYAYLGHRNKSLIPKFASEIRHLWNAWIDVLETNDKKDKRIFS